MGGAESKPTDVSDRVWQEAQTKKREEKAKQLEAQRETMARLELKRNNLLATTALQMNNYLRDCHGPWPPTFLFPSVRDRCEASRLAAMGHVLELISNASLAENQVKVTQWIEREL